MEPERRVLVVRPDTGRKLVGRCDGDIIEHPVRDEAHAVEVRELLRQGMTPEAAARDWRWSVED